MKELLILGLALALGGCAGLGHLQTEYAGIDVKPFNVDGDDIYRVFDKPEANELMITPSVAKAMSAGALSGATLGIADAQSILGQKSKYDIVVSAYLASTGRTCRILDGYIVIRGQWEYKYDCTTLPPPAPSTPVKRVPASSEQ